MTAADSVQGLLPSPETLEDGTWKLELKARFGAAHQAKDLSQGKHEPNGPLLLLRYIAQSDACEQGRQKVEALQELLNMPTQVSGLAVVEDWVAGLKGAIAQQVVGPEETWLKSWPVMARNCAGKNQERLGVLTTKAWYKVELTSKRDAVKRFDRYRFGDITFVRVGQFEQISVPFTFTVEGSEPGAEVQLSESVEEVQVFGFQLRYSDSHRGGSFSEQGIVRGMYNTVFSNPDTFHRKFFPFASTELLGNTKKSCRKFMEDVSREIAYSVAILKRFGEGNSTDGSPCLSESEVPLFYHPPWDLDGQGVNDAVLVTEADVGRKDDDVGDENGEDEAPVSAAVDGAGEGDGVLLSSGREDGPSEGCEDADAPAPGHEMEEEASEAGEVSEEHSGRFMETIERALSGELPLRAVSVAKEADCVEDEIATSASSYGSTGGEESPICASSEDKASADSSEENQGTFDASDKRPHRTDKTALKDCNDIGVKRHQESEASRSEPEPVGTSPTKQLSGKKTKKKKKKTKGKR
eukprot:scaffold516_cov401-Prasinococcus_capsulatus_cf.AAC.29